MVLMVLFYIVNPGEILKTSIRFDDKRNATTIPCRVKE